MGITQKGEALPTPTKATGPTVIKSLHIQGFDDPMKEPRITFEGDWTITELTALPRLMRLSHRRYITQRNRKGEATT